MLALPHQQVGKVGEGWAEGPNCLEGSGHVVLETSVWGFPSGMVGCGRGIETRRLGQETVRTPSNNVCSCLGQAGGNVVMLSHVCVQCV